MNVAKSLRTPILKNVHERPLLFHSKWTAVINFHTPIRLNNSPIDKCISKHVNEILE